MGERSLVCYATRMPQASLIDTDVASDDAVALIMALRAPDVSVVAITTVAGNVEVEQATRNALYTVELCGTSVPVYAGAEKPLQREHQSGHPRRPDHRAVSRVGQWHYACSPRHCRLRRRCWPSEFR